MVATNRIFEFYARAKEGNHPDPDRGVLGRAQLTGLNSAFNKDGKVGLFGLSEKEAKKIGWTDLENSEQSFRAMMEMDKRNFAETQDIDKMFMASAGTTKDNYLKKLAEATNDINGNLLWENGVPVGTTDHDIQNETELLDTEGLSKIDIEEETKKVSAELSMHARTRQSLGLENDASGDLSRYTQLLKEYIRSTV